VIRYPPLPLKAGYAAHSTRLYNKNSHRIAGFILIRTLLLFKKAGTVIGLHGKGVNARMPLQIAPKP